VARKPKPGKQFKYGLETVLKVRKIKETKEQEKFATKKRVYIKEKEEEVRIRDEDQDKKDSLRGKIKKGPIEDFTDVMRRRAHLGVLKEELDEQVEKVIEASKVLEDQRVKLISAMKDKKVIEKDRSNKFDEYHKLMASLEIKFMDEIATERFKTDKRRES